MADRISSLPDDILYKILFFLPTKESVRTCVLSKRWKPLWRSVLALEFNCHNNETYFHFVESVYSFILSRDLYQPLQRFSLACTSSFAKAAIVNASLNAAAQRKVESIDLNLSISIHLISPVLSCKTLVVLNLISLRVNAVFSVDLPSLKILHLCSVEFSDRTRLAEFLSGTPNLEHLETNLLMFSSFEAKGKFKRLSKLHRARIVANEISLDVVSNVQFLRLEAMNCEDIQVDVTPEFCNLTHIEFDYLGRRKCWFYVLELLQHCPKLQNLSIKKVPKRRGEDWPYPPRVPKCISKHLTTCCLGSYAGGKAEFEFAKYIMQNAGVLQDMTIRTLLHKEKELDMIKERLALCTRLSSTCKLSFKS